MNIDSLKVIDEYKQLLSDANHKIVVMTAYIKKLESQLPKESVKES